MQPKQAINAVSQRLPFALHHTLHRRISLTPLWHATTDLLSITGVLRFVKEKWCWLLDCAYCPFFPPPLFVHFDSHPYKCTLIGRTTVYLCNMHKIGGAFCDGFAVSLQGLHCLYCN